jgi:magnesium transporter
MGLRRIRRSLIHHKETACGSMTTGYLSVTPDTTVEMAIARLRVEAPNLDMMHYIYVVNKENVLQGVVSIRGLLTAQPHQLLTEIWTQRLLSVKPEANQKEIVEVFAKYRLQALPVLDEGNHLKGVIRFQAVLDILLPKVR